MNGDELVIDRFTGRFDDQGTFTGGTDVVADVTSGFSFSIASRLRTAEMSASAIPASRCTYDQDGNQIGCKDTTLSSNASWTGVGPIATETDHYHYRNGGYLFNYFAFGTQREATATGTIGGISLGADALASADMGVLKSGGLTVCIGNKC